MKKITSILAAVALALALVPAGAFAPGAPQAHAATAGAFTVTGGTSGTDYSYDSQTGVLTVLTSQPLTIKNTNPNVATQSSRIVVAKDVPANITLAGVNIRMNDANEVAFEIENGSTGNVTITLAEGTTNTLKSGDQAAGLEKNGTDNVGTLTITGSGALNATGGDFAAGIGATNIKNGDTANIRITGGTINATGGGGFGIGGAGIGGSSSNGRGSGSATNITITGGTVTATGTNAPGIGGGSGGSAENITIAGGTVTARGHGIGGDNSAPSTNIRIYGGSVLTNRIGAQPKAADGSTNTYLLKIANPDSKAVVIDGAAWTPSNHTAADSSDTTLYAYLTEGEHSIVIGTKQHTYAYENGQFVLKGTTSLTNPVTMEVRDGTWHVSYDGGDTWNDLGVNATGDNGITPQLQVSSEGYWQVSYDGGNDWINVTDASGDLVKATGDTGATGNGISGVTSATSEDGGTTVTIYYTNGTSSTFTVAKGDKGDKGDQGEQGPRGEKGDKGDKGETGATGATGAAGATGATGAAGADGRNGVTPQLEVDADGYLLVSYDGGATFSSLGTKVAVASAVERVRVELSSVRSLKVTAKKGGKAKVSWKAPRGVKGLRYQVKYKKKGGKYRSVKTSKLSKTAKRLKAGKKYTFKVRGYKTVGGKRVYTGWRTVKGVRARR